MILELVQAGFEYLGHLFRPWRGEGSEWMSCFRKGSSAVVVKYCAS